MRDKSARNSRPQPRRFHDARRRAHPPRNPTNHSIVDSVIAAPIPVVPTRDDDVIDNNTDADALVH